MSKILAICCRAEAYDDFLAIAKLIIKKDPKLAVVIKSTSYHPDELDPTLSHYPLLNIYLVNPPQVIPSRGKTLFVKAINKLEQYQHYAIENISTPKTIDYKVDQEINFKEWGEFVFLKSRNDSYGRNSFLIPIKEISNIKPYFEKLGLKNEMLLQEFIYTGQNVNHYRVLNFLGEPLFCVKNTNLSNIKLPVTLDDAFNNHTVKTNFSNDTRKVELSENKEVLNFSKSVFNVFPERPLQGIDIIIEQNTKKLFVLEGNQGGNVWTFSHKKSFTLAAYCRTMGLSEKLGRFTLLNQFNAFDVACDILIKKTNKLAI